HGHRQLLPALAAVVAAIDLAVLVPRVHHLRVAGVERQRPHGQAVVDDVDLVPVLAVVGAAIRAVLRPDIYALGIVRLRRDGADGRRLGQPTRALLPSIVAGGYAVEARLDGAARGWL